MTHEPTLLLETLACTAAEALMWGAEADPSLRFRIVAVLDLDGVPDWSVLTDRVDRLTRLVPRLRHRIVSRPLPGLRPHWELDPAFDLDRHLSIRALPAGSGEPDVLLLAEQERMADFEPGRSPWRATMVTGLPGGRAAFILALNHVITDGVGAVRMGSLILDLDAQGPSAEDLGDLAPIEAPRPRRQRDQLVIAVTQELGLLAGVPGSAAAVLRGVRDPLSVGQSLVDAGRAAVRFLPLPQAASPLPREWTPEDRYLTLDVPVAGLKAAGRAAGGKFNDAYLAALVGGFKRYHDLHELPLPTVTITMPVNTRQPGSTDVGGNEMLLKICSVPADMSDPAARIAEISIQSRQEQSAGAHGVSQAITQTLARLPGPVLRHALGQLADGIDLPTTNVPGVPVPVYLAGVPVTRILPFLNRGRSPLTAALISYNGTAHIALTIDPIAIPDPDTLVTCLNAEFDVVLALAATEERADVPA